MTKINPLSLDGNPLRGVVIKSAEVPPTDIYPQATQAEREGLTLPGEAVHPARSIRHTP